MIEVVTTHTSDLGVDDRRGLRALLDEAFEGAYTDEDWDNTLGGMHVLARDGADLLGHASVVQRRLTHGGQALRTGYVEGVAVAGGHRRTGIAARALDEIERIIRSAYEVGALSDGTDIPGFYERRGWLRWRGPTSVLTPRELRRTPEEDRLVHVLPTPASPTLDPADALTCDWRPGDAW